MIVALLRRALKSFRPKEHLRSMSAKEAAARLVPDSHGVEVLESSDGRLTDSESDERSS